MGCKDKGDQVAAAEVVERVVMEAAMVVVVAAGAVEEVVLHHEVGEDVALQEAVVVVVALLPLKVGVEVAVEPVQEPHLRLPMTLTTTSLTMTIHLLRSLLLRPHPAVGHAKLPYLYQHHPLK